MVSGNAAPKLPTNQTKTSKNRQTDTHTSAHQLVKLRQLLVGEPRAKAAPLELLELVVVEHVVAVAVAQRKDAAHGVHAAVVERLLGAAVVQRQRRIAVRAARKAKTKKNQ